MTPLRPAEASDVGTVAALEQELFGADAWSPTVVHDELLGERRRAVVAVEQSPVGYAVTMLGDGLVDLQRIAVAPSHRRGGIARRLLEEMSRLARQDGADLMLLEVSVANTGALAFYADAGFVEIDRRRRYYRDGSDAVVMRAALGTAACGRRT